MITLEEIKTAAAALSPDEQVEFFRWWTRLDTFKARQLAALKRDIAVGADHLDEGHYRTYDDANLHRLAEEVGKSAVERLENRRNNPPA